MAGLKEIRRRLRSVNNTKKITYAMKLVSAAKLKRAQDSVTSFRSYRNEIDRLLGKLQGANDKASFNDPLLVAHEQVKRICIVVIGGQRGLCGGYNSNVSKKVEAVIAERRAETPDAEIEFVLIGKKIAEYFRRMKRAYAQAYEELPESVVLWPLDQIGRELKDKFLAGTYDEVWVIYTFFKSVISNVPTCEKILPLAVGQAGAERGTSEAGGSSAAILEPSGARLFAAVLPRVLNSRVRQFCLDSKASEIGSRMTAMDAATRNAGQLVRKLELKHNKLRQNRITSELLDIVGGAEAIK